MHRWRKEAFDFPDAEEQIRADIGQVLGSFKPLSFEDQGVTIAPFVNTGETRLTERTIQRRRLSAPLIGARLIPKVAINTRYNERIFAGSPNGKLAFILVGDHNKALPLGQTAVGDTIYLTHKGYIGESVPPLAGPEPSYPLFSRDDTGDGQYLLDWQSSLPGSPESSPILPVVSLHPDRHISNFPNYLINILGRVSTKSRAE
jgi:hypothetical protein